MTTPCFELVERMLIAFETKDLNAVLACFAEDAVLIDPHYPQSYMIGKTAIAEGVKWAFGAMTTFGFTIVNSFEADDGHTVAVEVDTQHVVRGSIRVQIRQTFVIETRDDHIMRLQAYGPYGPGGLGGILLWLTRLQQQFVRKRQGR